MRELVTASAVMDWSYGASILTFVFPMLLFVAVAAALYVLYTKPHLVPGHHYERRMRATTHTVAPMTPGPAPAVDTTRITGHAPRETDNEA